MTAGPVRDHPAAVPAGPRTAGDPSRLTSRLLAILAIVIVASMLDLMDSQITNIAASIVRDIGGGKSLIKWLGASYQLAIGMFLVIGGRLGDWYGKRLLCLICGLAVDPAMIVAGRLMQGAFGALLIPQGIRILMASFCREQLPRDFGAFGPVLGLSAVLGPVVGGFIISADLAGLDRRPVFLIGIVFGTAGLVAAAVLFAALAVRQRRATSPLIKPTLLLNKGFTSGWSSAWHFSPPWPGSPI